MDTRMWGGSGWTGVHGGAKAADADAAMVKPVAAFVGALPYALPCRYCRSSLTGYMRQLPPPPATRSSSGGDRWSRWAYAVHNLVNGKLRSQGLLKTKNPPFAEVDGRYAALLAAPGPQPMRGWDFLAAVAWTTPPVSDAAALKASAPMPDVPVPPPSAPLWQRNAANTVPPAERRRLVARFWETVGPALSRPEWRAAWAAAVDAEGPAPVAKGPRAVTAWLCRVRGRVCGACSGSGGPKAPSYAATCAELKAFASGCGGAGAHDHASTSGRASSRKTCRAQKLSARRALTLKRKRVYAATGGFI
jgi:hypothetical protein